MPIKTIPITIITLAIASLAIGFIFVDNSTQVLKRNHPENFFVGTPSQCMSYLPYNIWNDPQVDYYNWYGLQGKDIKGKTYLTGHAFQRHVAVNGACTLQQKQQNKTVFYNLVEFQKAASKIPSTCDVANHTTFTYDYNGKMASATEYISGIDCTTGKREMFPAYFVEFKRAIRNSHPTEQQYLASNYVTVWTFYPKRS